jgi:hypothetical protein
MNIRFMEFLFPSSENRAAITPRPAGRDDAGEDTEDCGGLPTSSRSENGLPVVDARAKTPIQPDWCAEGCQHRMFQ